MTPNRTRRAAAVLAVVVLFGAAACSSSDDKSSDSSDKTTTTASGSGGSDGSSTTAADDSSGSGAGGDAGAKGTGKVTLADGEAAADKITVDADGAFDPDSLSVAVGEKFTVKAADGAGTHAVTFDGGDSYTVSGGLIETFTIDAAGTYTMTDTISESTATITVS